MQLFKQTLIALTVAALAACTTSSEQDRTLLSATSQNAEQAKTTAQQALDAARSAQASANSAQASADKAAQAATQAAADAKAANEKADRMFQRSLRK